VEGLNSLVLKEAPPQFFSVSGRRPDLAVETCKTYSLFIIK